MLGRRSRRFSALAFALTLAALAVPGPAGTQTLPTLKVAATANDTYAEAYYAVDMGFFKKAGLNVDLQTFANGAAVSTAVAAGAADVGISNPVQLANAFSHGAPFTLVAGGGMYATDAPTTVMCVAKNSPFKVAKDLEGKTIAISALRDLTQLGAVAWLSQNGADTSKMKFVEMPFAEMGPALARGTVDAAVISEPSLTAAKDAGSVRVFAKVFSAIAPQFLIGAWFSTTTFAQKNPDLIKRFQTAIYEAARWANKNHEQSAAILAKYSKITAETARTMTRCTYADGLTPRIVQPPLDLAFKNNVLDKSVTAGDMIFK
ncbi:MAG TPA: ABC transporter substrate-binding protein [Candidatus Acidoferrales bacterium]|nr:ABC transporter substrate-binding protein [Candidatus Acidoferrales bacterium]